MSEQRKKIDINRPHTMRYKDGQANFPVYMYKDEPGVYRNVFEMIVSDEVAKEAGFPVEELSKQRELTRRVAEAYDEIRKELELQEGEEATIRERGGIRIVPFGKHFHVKDEHGNTLSPIPLDKDSAFLLLDKLVPAEKPIPKTSSAKAKAQKEADTEE